MHACTLDNFCTMETRDISYKTINVFLNLIHKSGTDDFTTKTTNCWLFE